MLFWLGCVPNVAETPKSLAVEHLDTTDVRDTSLADQTTYVVSITTSFTTAWVEEGAIESTVSEDVRAGYFLHQRTQRSTEEGEPDGYTPVEIALSSGIWCVSFVSESDEGARTQSQTVCENSQTTSIMTSPLCLAITGDWICEDMWGVGTPETFYVNRDVEMENGCEVELIGVTWGSQRAQIDGNLLTFQLGGYAATGVIGLDGLSINFKVDYDLDYWSTCQQMY